MKSWGELVGILVACLVVVGIALGINSCVRANDKAECEASGGTLVDVSGGKGHFCLPPGRR